MEDNLKLRFQSFLEIIFSLIETRVDLENPRLLSNTPTQKKTFRVQKTLFSTKKIKICSSKKIPNLFNIFFYLNILLIIGYR